MTDSLEQLLGEQVITRKRRALLRIAGDVAGKWQELVATGLQDSGVGLSCLLGPYSVALEEIGAAWIGAVVRLTEAQPADGVDADEVVSVVRTAMEADAKALGDQARTEVGKHAPAPELADALAAGLMLHLVVSDTVHDVRAELNWAPFCTSLRSAEREAVGESSPEYLFREEAGVWNVAFGGEQEFVKDSKGMRLIRQLLERPGWVIPALLLYMAANGHVPLPESRHLLGEYDEDGKAPGQLVTDDEKARKNVQRNTANAIARFEQASLRRLALHLRGAISTGNRCQYAPSEKIPWQF